MVKYQASLQLMPHLAFGLLARRVHEPVMTAFS